MNNYRFKDVSGKIGQSGVFLGTDKRTGKSVAIKLFSNVTEQQKERLLRDAQVLQKIKHPNIVRFLDSGVDAENNVFYVMEYLKGSTLKGGISFQKSLVIIEQIASALSVLHEHGIL